jgi:hypothetical protein
MSQTSESRGPRRNNELLDTAEDFAVGVGRLGYSLISLGLEFLPRRSRAHMHRALRELSYAFATLPGGYTTSARAAIDAWADEGEDGAARTPRAQQVRMAGEGATMLTAASAAAGPAPGSSAPRTVPAPSAPAASGDRSAPPAPAAKSTPPAPPAPAAAGAPAASAAAKSAPPASAPSAPAAAGGRSVPPAPAAGGRSVPPASSMPAPTGGRAVPPAPTPLGAAVAAKMAGVTIAHIEYNPPGRDVEGEFVLLRNSSSARVDLTGWTLRDGNANHVYVFPAFVLAPGAEVKLWTRVGANDAANLYWGERSAIWNNNGDTGTLSDAAGAVISRFSYSGKK